jgi:hypothetical protein
MHKVVREFGTEDVGSLSAKLLAELLQDYDLSEGPESEGPLPFGEPEPSVAKKTELGARIVAVAKGYLDKPVREDAGTNADKDGLIRSFFLEGVPWKSSYWDDWVTNHPTARCLGQSGVRRLHATAHERATLSRVLPTKSPRC